jgi:hypothetical protein
MRNGKGIASQEREESPGEPEDLEEAGPHQSGQNSPGATAE